MTNFNILQEIPVSSENYYTNQKMESNHISMDAELCHKEDALCSSADMAMDPQNHVRIKNCPKKRMKKEVARIQCNIGGHSNQIIFQPNTREETFLNSHSIDQLNNHAAANHFAEHSNFSTTNNHAANQSTQSILNNDVTIINEDAQKKIGSGDSEFVHESPKHISHIRSKDKNHPSQSPKFLSASKPNVLIRPIYGNLISKRSKVTFLSKNQISEAISLLPTCLSSQQHINKRMRKTVVDAIFQYSSTLFSGAFATYLLDIVLTSSKSITRERFKDIGKECWKKAEKFFQESTRYFEPCIIEYPELEFIDQAISRLFDNFLKTRFGDLLTFSEHQPEYSTSRFVETYYNYGLLLCYPNVYYAKNKNRPLLPDTPLSTIAKWYAKLHKLLSTDEGVEKESVLNLTERILNLFPIAINRKIQCKFLKEIASYYQIPMDESVGNEDLHNHPHYHSDNPYLLVCADHFKDPIAMFYIGLAFRRRPKTLDRRIAFDYFNQASERHHLMSKCLLGNMYLIGSGVEKDTSKAMELFDEVIAKDSSIAEPYFYKGVHFEFDLLNGKEAVQWYRKASERGFGRAELYLGFLHCSDVENYLNLSCDVTALRHFVNAKNMATHYSAYYEASKQISIQREILTSQTCLFSS